METVEAVIISGPRKGEIVVMRDEQFAPRNGGDKGDSNGETEPQLSPEEAAMLDSLVLTMNNTARHAEEAAQAARRLREKFEAA